MVERYEGRLLMLLFSKSCGTMERKYFFFSHTSVDDQIGRRRCRRKENERFIFYLKCDYSELY